jgi:hypothetical protein
MLKPRKAAAPSRRVVGNFKPLARADRLLLDDSDVVDEAVQRTLKPKSPESARSTKISAVCQPDRQSEADVHC